MQSESYAGPATASGRARELRRGATLERVKAHLAVLDGKSLTHAPLDDAERLQALQALVGAMRHRGRPDNNRLLAIIGECVLALDVLAERDEQRVDAGDLLHPDEMQIARIAATIGDLREEATLAQVNNVDLVAHVLYQALKDGLDQREAVVCCDCGKFGVPSCDRDGHGLAMLGELIDCYGNPHAGEMAA